MEVAVSSEFELDQQITLENLFLFKEIYEDQWGTPNLIGWLGPHIVVNDFPYMLYTNVALFAHKKNAEPSGKIEFYVSKDALDGRELLRSTTVRSMDIPVFPRDNMALFVGFPFKIHLFEPGLMRIRSSVLGGPSREWVFQVSKGRSPTLAADPGEIGFSSIVSADSPLDIFQFVKSADQEVFLVDPYVSDSFLKQLLDHLPTTAKAKVLTSMASKGKVSATHPGQLDLRYDPENTFHDRFLIINETEYFHFGHSLKDINGKRISLYHRITSRTVIEALGASIEKAWKTAYTSTS